MINSNKKEHSTHRAVSLDALRGFSILAMVLSSTIAFGILPGWMYHMQAPPPQHVFCPDLSGLTWVDLVFPLFLFAMGASFPFSIRKKYETHKSYLICIKDIILRWGKLVFFALFIQHFYPFTLSNPQDMRAWILSLLCFVLLFPMYMRIPSRISAWAHWGIRLLAYGIAVIMLMSTHYFNEPELNLYNSNIIILLLANMALFGSIIFLFTMNNPMGRIVILLLLSGLLFSAQVEDSWANQCFDFTPCGWIYRFEYLQYLFIVIPGTFAGDFLLRWTKQQADISPSASSVSPLSLGVLLLSIFVVVVILIGLYNRWSFLTLLCSVLLLYLLWLMVCHIPDCSSLWRNLLLYAICFILIGLCFEPFQGGIKKDGPTISYLLLTSGIGFIVLLIFQILCEYIHKGKFTAYLSLVGQNPMIAYVVCSLLIFPLLNIFHLMQYVEAISVNPWGGLLRGIVLTWLASAITVFFTGKKCFWKT